MAKRQKWFYFKNKSIFTFLTQGSICPDLIKKCIVIMYITRFKFWSYPLYKKCIFISFRGEKSIYSADA